MAIRAGDRGFCAPIFERVLPAAPNRPGLATRLVRCFGVSVVTTVISVSTLVVASAGLGMRAWFANILATSVATVPSYHLNRQWTWGKRGVSDPWREVMPFWALAFAGLALSTLFVALTDPWMTHLHADLAVHTGAVVGAHLSGFGVLWAVQFVLLDRVLFRAS
jgi:putative flippase GtrA